MTSKIDRIKNVRGRLIIREKTHEERETNK